MSADCNSCSYDCSASPTNVCPNTDITGIGVLIGYAFTALFAVVLVPIYYTTVFSPRAYPFRKDDGSADEQALAKFHPNPIDKYVLRRAETKFPRNDDNESDRPSHLENVLIKCALSMSDLQIITGISILVSGYTQLKCGLSAFHWQVVVYLAWFSSLTHLSGLSVLRGYLYKNPGQRLWRWIAMAVIVVMLVTAIIPTGNFDWSPGDPNIDTADLEPSPTSYAICFYGQAVSKNRRAYPTMIISTVLLIFGFLARVVRLHKTLSIDIVLYLRSNLSRFARKCLRKVYGWCNVQTNAPSLIRLLLYRPLLTVFLVCRVFLDMWSSMFLEVWWLLVAFIWGAIRLGYTLRLYGVDTSRGAWTFGQVISLVLLAAPLISILEFLFEQEDRTGKSSKTNPGRTEAAQANGSAESQSAGPPATEPGAGTVARPETPAEPSQSRTPTMEIAEQLYTAPLHGFRDDPDFDFYRESSWFNHIILYFLWMAFSLGMTVLLFTALGDDIFWNLIYPYYFDSWQWTPLVIFWVLMCFTLFVITVEDIGTQFLDSPTRRVLLVLIKGVIYLFCSAMYLGLGIGIFPARFGSRFGLSMINPCAALALTLLVMVGSETKPRPGVRPISIIESLLVIATYMACAGMLPVILGYVPYVRFTWLYLLIPPGLYVMVSLGYWGLSKIRTFMPTFRRNR